MSMLSIHTRIRMKEERAESGLQDSTMLAVPVLSTPADEKGMAASGAEVGQDTREILMISAEGLLAGEILMRGVDAEGWPIGSIDVSQGFIQHTLTSADEHWLHGGASGRSWEGKLEGSPDVGRQL